MRPLRSSRTLAVTIIVGIVVLLAIGLLASRVGGIAIRNNTARSEAPVTLTISQPVVRGVPVVVHWSVPAGEAPEAVLAYFRDTDAELAVGEADVVDGLASIELPCEGTATTGSIVLRSRDTERVISQIPIQLLPAGPECALR